MALKDYLTKDEALYLPKGSVRAIMALTLIAGCIYLAVKTGDLKTLIGLAGAAVGYYYGGKRESAESTTIKEE